MRKCILVFTLIVILSVFLAIPVSCGEVSGSGNNTEGNDIVFRKSDVFYSYSKVLWKPELAVNNMYLHAVDHMNEMEDNDSDILGVFQSALTDPEGGTADALWNWFSGQDRMEERCTYDAVESLLRIIAEDDYMGFESSRLSVLQGLFDSVKEDAKELESVGELGLKLFKYNMECNSAQVSDVTRIVFDCADGQIYTSGFALPEVMEALESTEDAVSYIGDRLDNAENLLSAVNTICLLETIDTHVLYTLRDHMYSQQFISAVDRYIDYKETNYADYIAERYLKKDLLSAAKKFVSDELKTAINEGIVGNGAFNIYYSVAKSGLKMLGKAIGNHTGIGDGDKFATAYYSWNIVQELERKLSEVRAQVAYYPAYYDDIQGYATLYELYAQAVHNFAVSVGECDNQYKETILEGDEGFLENRKNQYGGSAFGAYVRNCVFQLETADDVNEYRRPVDQEEIPNYEIDNGTLTISGPSDEIEEDTIYTAPDGDLFYGLQLGHWSTVNFTGDCVIPTDLSYERSGVMHTIMIPEGVTVRIRGNFDQLEFRERYYDTSTQDYLENRLLDVHGSLIVEGDMRLNVCTFILSGSHASLEVDGAYTMDNSYTYGCVREVIDAESIHLNGNVYTPENLKNIGYTTIYLNPEPGETAVTGRVQLLEPDDGFIGEEPAEIMLQGLGNRNETYLDDFVFAEVKGNAPSHKVKIDHAIQCGNSVYHTLSGGYLFTTTGDVSVTGDMIGSANITGGSLHVGGNLGFGLVKVGKDTEVTVDGDAAAMENNPGDTGAVLNISGTMMIGGMLDTTFKDSICLDEQDAVLEVMGGVSIYADENTFINGSLLLHEGGYISAFDTLQDADIIMLGDHGEDIYLYIDGRLYIEGNGEDCNLTIRSEEGVTLIGPTDPDKPVAGRNLGISNDKFILESGTYAFADGVSIYYSWITGQLQLDGNYIFTGDLSIDNAQVVQDKANSSLEVKGEFYLGETEANLSAGQWNIGGNIVLYNSTINEEQEHKTSLNGTGAQRLSNAAGADTWFSFATLILSNESAEGVTLDENVSVSTLLYHQRRAFTLQGEDETRFADYDGDGVRDPWDPEPKNPLVSFIPFSVQPIEDQIYTGEPITPSLAVIDDEGSAMTEGQDYTVTWENNVSSTHARAVVQGLGFHRTTFIAEFVILGGSTEPVYPGPDDAVLVIGESITRLEDEAFANCAQVRFIFFKGDMPAFGEKVFSGISQDAVIYYPEGNATWSAEALEEAGISLLALPWMP